MINFLFYIFLIVLCAVPFLLYQVWHRIANYVDEKILRLECEKSQFTEKYDTDVYNGLSYEITKMTNISKVLKPTNKILQGIGIAYSCVAITLLILTILALFFGTICCISARFSYNKFDEKIVYYENLPSEKLQSTTIKRAEELNDNITNSMFLTKEEKDSMTLIDTQLLWARFFESVGDAQGREAVYKEK